MSASRRTTSGGRSLPAKAPASLRHCKAYLRRRLAHDPPALRQEGCANTGTTTSSPSSERSSTRREGGDGDASGKGASPWEGWWPVGLRTQCEELRKASFNPLTSVCWVGMGNFLCTQIQNPWCCPPFFYMILPYNSTLLIPVGHSRRRST